ncbi:Single-strand selective monofunctional uracil DNA glycosylase [Galdieria sulphuraria]|nr:Single-strand selective monofunctional uracil DNA glycosylase [Galdieria sulphuraria]
MSSSTQGAERLLEWESTLVKDLRSLRFPPPVSYQYSPLEYAWPLHQEYVRRYFLPTARILFVGMNPGPFGMVQSGIPFGDVTTVKDWFHIRGELRKEALPKQVHPKRPILGLLCPRKEVSGQRFWGWARQGWTTMERILLLISYVLVDWMRPVFVFGLGKFSYQVCCDVIGHICAVGMLPHPSPANPKSSRYWSQWSTVANDIREQCRQQNIHIELPY